MNEAFSLRDQGEFEKASRVLQSYLDQTTATLSHDDHRQVEFEIERIRRIRQDYRLNRDQVLKQLQDRLTTFTGEQLDNYEREGKLDVQLIDGQKLYVNSTVSNLILRAPELKGYLKHQRPSTSLYKVYRQMKQAKAASLLTSSPLVLPQDFLVTYTLTVDANAVKAGSTVRCWLPYARAVPSQSDMEILETEPAISLLSPPKAFHRTVYFERKAEAGKPVKFKLAFVYRSWARNFEPDPNKVIPYDKSNPIYQKYTRERKPHIDFSSEDLKRVNVEISGGDTNPLKVARRIYDWIAKNTIYQYSREYSTIENLSGYTAARRAGDCGQHGMLFIALCRMNGIPARWTTGWESFAQSGQNMHDWCEFYVEPYGWLPADPDMAVNVTHYSEDELTSAQRTELVDWMFGNMDNDRLIVNGDYSMPLDPPKQDFRSETVDFQRGEVECNGANLYFDKWDYRMRIEPIPAKEAEALRAKFIPPVPDVQFPEFHPKQVPASEPPSTGTVNTSPTSGAVNTAPTTGTVTENPKPATEKTSATAESTSPTKTAVTTTSGTVQDAKSTSAPH